MTKPSNVVVPFRKRSARRPSGQLDLFDPLRSEASLRFEAALSLGSQMALSEARRMLALKTQQALSSARGPA
jgi:hypothetical protein